MKGLKDMDEMLSTLDLSDKQLPQIKDWKVGGRYKIIVEVEQRGMHKMENGMRANFDVVSAKSAGEVKNSKDVEPKKPVGRSEKVEHMREKAMNS